MILQFLGCFGGETPQHRMTCILIDEIYLLDAGCATSALAIEQQLKIESVIISHSHWDHIISVPLLLDNFLMMGRQKSLTVSSIEPVIENLKKHVFNNLLWPDYASISRLSSLVEFEVFKEEEENKVGHLNVIPIAVNHTTPAVGYIIRQKDKSLLYTGDTGPTEKIWEIANSLPDIKCVIVESTFPSRLSNVARLSKHMTPQTLKIELKKLNNKDIPILIFHAKPQYFNEIEEEISSIGNSHIEMIKPGAVYIL